jgi:large subunit ribosomal protein L21e
MRSKGVRSNTRQKFKKDYRDHGCVKTGRILEQYKRGDYVDILADSSIHKGMPHRHYHGKTGRVYAVFKNSVGVAIQKTVGNKRVVKQVIIRIEHVRQSNCQKDARARDRARAETGEAPAKCLPKGPRQAFTVSLEMNTPLEVKPSIHRAIF